MSPALSSSYLPGLSSVFSLACHQSLESCGSSSDGSKSQSPPPLPVPASVDPCLLLFGHHTYQAVALIGQGSYGKVYKAKQIGLMGDVAIKLLPRGDSVRAFRTLIRREILHHSSLQHPFIVSLKEVFLTPKDLALVMEYAPGGDLYQHVVRRDPCPWLPEDQARWIFQQLLIGLDYCHRKGVAVRDLKLENILLDRADSLRPLLKICDFGFSKHDATTPAKTKVGTPGYTAPEIIMAGQRYDAKKADLWSCGVLLYALLYGRYPFDADQKYYVRKIVAAEYVIPQDIPVSSECKQLLRGLLVPNPQHRMSIADVLSQPWFRQDLPQGALDMNYAYLAYHLSLDQYMTKIDAIINNAAEPSFQGEDLRLDRAWVPKTPT